MESEACSAPAIPARVLLTRPQGRNEALADALRGAGLKVLVAPALTLEQLDTPRPLPRTGDLCIFVSGQAVTAYFSDPAARWPGGAWAAAVGQATAQALRTHVPVDRILAPGAADSPDSESLFRVIQARAIPAATAHVLRATRGRDWLANQLRQCGWQVHCHALYRRSPAVWDRPTCEYLCLGDDPRILLLTSLDALTAIENSLQGCRLSWPAELKLVALHERIARRLQCIYADQPDSILHVGLSGPQEAALFQAIVAASRQPS